MNRQLIFLIGVGLLVLPWPQLALPYILKFFLILLYGLTLIFQSMKRSARMDGMMDKR